MGAGDECKMQNAKCKTAPPGTVAAWIIMIRASEVGEYVYCARAWWLRRVAGEEPEGQARREAGTAMHAAHGRGVALSGVALWAGLVVLALGVALWLLA